MYPSAQGHAECDLYTYANNVKAPTLHSAATLL